MEKDQVIAAAADEESKKVAIVEPESKTKTGGKKTEKKTKKPEEQMKQLIGYGEYSAAIRIKRRLNKRGIRCESFVPRAIAIAIDYIISEVTQGASAYTIDNGRSTISNDDIKDSIKHDEELNKLFKEVVFVHTADRYGGLPCAGVTAKNTLAGADSVKLLKHKH